MITTFQAIVSIVCLVMSSVALFCAGYLLGMRKGKEITQIVQAEIRRMEKENG